MGLFSVVKGVRFVIIEICIIRKITVDRQELLKFHYNVSRQIFV